jgi:hypothetical protein
MGYAYTFLVEKPVDRASIGRKESRWKDRIKINTKEVGKKGMDIIQLGQDGAHLQVLVNTANELIKG